MAFTALATNLSNITALGTKPNIDDGLTATQVKVLFDKAANDIKTYINSVLLVELATITAGASAAHNLGAAAIAGVSGTTIATQLVDLKAQIDAAVIGTIPDASITEDKLEFAVATQAELDLVIAAYLAADAEIIHRMYMGV